MNKEFFIISGIILILIISAIYLSPKTGLIGKSIQAKSPSNVVQVQLSKENFHLFLQQQTIVKELPQNALISLRLYNFDRGYREWEKSYIITKSSVKEGKAENPDIEITVASKYIFDFARDMCSAVSKAKANKDFSAYSNLKTASLLWKYKSMVKYRDCFGL